MKKAFTIIETLIAVTILMLVTTGVIFSLGGSLRATSGSDTRLQAELLADEGIELVRAVKDANLLAVSPFYQGISTCTAASPCYVVNDDPGIPQMVPCGGTCPTLKTTSLGYGYQAGAQSSIFTRSIVAEELQSDSNGRPAELRITSTVSYQEKGTTMSSVSRVVMTNWYE